MFTSAVVHYNNIDVVHYNKINDLFTIFVSEFTLDYLDNDGS